MAERQLNPIVKLLLEIGPLAVFFIAYRMAPVSEGADATEAQLDQILFATQVFIPIILLSLLITWLLVRRLPRMPLITAVLVVVFGGLTLWLRDDTFIKMKPTILYLLFAAGLGFGLLRGQSYLQYLMEDMIPLRAEGWMIFTRRFVYFFIATAILNEIVWRSFDTDTWVNFRTFVLPALSFVFIMTQASIFTRYAIEDDQTDS